MRRIVVAMLCVLAASPSLAGIREKKIVLYGGADTAFVKKHVAEMERLPIDGMGIVVNGTDGHGKSTGALGWQTFTKTSFKPNDCQKAIDDLKATKFRRLTDNFILFQSCPGAVDWFDSDWSIIIHNVACLARVAKQGGCKGLMLDPEMYNEPPTPWSYSKLPENLRKAHTYPEYRDMARKRGREVMRAINKEFPDAVIFTLFANSLSLGAAHSEAFLAFGGADDAAKVWLNGVFVGEHDIPSGAEKPFAMEVTNLLRPGGENVLAVDVRNGQGPGGLWKSIKLMSK